MNIKPLLKNIVVERIEVKKESEFGIILQSSDEAELATVIAVGSSVTEVSPGERVLLDWNKSQKIQDDIYQVSVDNVIAVFE